jgi:hypothetical protein
MEAAYGRRKLREMKVRRLAARGLNLLGGRPAAEPADFLEFTPRPRDATEFSDLCARVACYLGDVDVALYLPGADVFTADPQTVPYMDPALVRDPGWVSSRPAGRSKLVVHRLMPRTIAELLRHGAPGATVVDKDLFFMTELSYWRVRDEVAWPNYPSAEVSLERLRARFPDAQSSYILATGPSANEVDLGRVVADVRITCNSTVSDADRLQAYSPNIIAFTDPVFHFGPSRYAAAFRKDLIRAVEMCDPILLCGDEWVAPLLNLHPDLRDRLAVIPFRRGGPWRWPTDENPTVRSASSVLTNTMLPIAFMLTDHISVAGVDGRQPTENYFWKHGVQYSDELMQTVFDAHPAFFRDRDYEDYYDQYCADIESFVGVAEAAGKVVVGAAPSWIPAFRRRGAPEPVPAR